MSTYETFPSASVISIPNNINICDKLNTMRNRFHAGYIQTIAKNKETPKCFEVSWNSLEYDEWLELVKFIRSKEVLGEVFYWQYPTAIYGETPYGGATSTAIESGFGSVKTYGYSEGPYFLVTVIEDSLNQNYILNTNKFEVTIKLEEYL